MKVIKNKYIFVRLTEEQKKIAEEKAKKRGMFMTEYVWYLIKKDKIK